MTGNNHVTTEHENKSSYFLFWLVCSISLVNIIPTEFFYTSINNNGYFHGIYVLCKHTISLTNFTSFFQFAGEMSDYHMYKFFQNNLYSYNMIADSLRKIHISENREKNCSEIVTPTCKLILW